jgi:acetyltransferase-like isoleucine patch superfamily enzyme
MLSEEPFLPNTAKLVDERKLSLKASCRFNNAIVQMGSGEHGWPFERIVAAEWIYPRGGERQVTGHLGGGITVSMPLYCDYGYSISIGDNAIIGPDCQMRDSGRIAIGRDTKIGARVTISTQEEPTVTKLPKRNNGTETARDVYIGENVHIGDGCIIEAGVRIGHNAIVGAGSVVVQACVHLSSFSENLH